MPWPFGKEKDIAGKQAVRRASAKGRATAGGCGRGGVDYRETFKKRQKTIRKANILYGWFSLWGSKPEVLVGTACEGQPDRTGGHALQGVIPEGCTVGAGGHDPLFGAHHLSGVQLTAPGTVGAAGLDGGLKQLDGSSLLLSYAVKTIILHPAAFFHCFFVPPRL